MKYLIDFGVNIDIGIPEPPLIGALIGGHTDVAIFLIHHGADCDIKDLVKLFWTVHNNRLFSFNDIYYQSY